MNNISANKLVVAIGSSHADDRAAWDIADLLMELPAGQVTVKKASAPLNMIDWLDDVDELHIIDACDGGEQVGQLLRSEWHQGQKTFATLRRSGTHDFDVLSVLELAGKLNRLPERTIIWGIVGKNFEPCHSLSSEIQCRLSDIAIAVCQSLESL